jgi:hypothetical protein
LALIDKFLGRKIIALNLFTFLGRKLFAKSGHPASQLEVQSFLKAFTKIGGRSFAPRTQAIFTTAATIRVTRLALCDNALGRRKNCPQFRSHFWDKKVCRI